MSRTREIGQAYAPGLEVPLNGFDCCTSSEDATASDCREARLSDKISAALPEDPFVVMVSPATIFTSRGWTALFAQQLST
jgi:hypothetical protein